MPSAAAPVGNCQALIDAIGWLAVVRLSSTSALFYLRVRAIMHGYNWLIAFYTIIWLGNIGAAFEAPFSVSAEHIGPLKYCVNTAVKSFVGGTFAASAIHDTLVYL